MSASLPPYPSYRASGVAWFSEVPSHWTVRKLRHLLRPATFRGRGDLPLLSVVRERGVVERNVEDRVENHNYVPDDLTNYKVVRPGQFAMNKMKAWQGSYGISPYEGVVSPAYFVFDLDGAAGSFFHSAIRSRAYVPLFTAASDGVRIGQWDLSKERMKEIPFFVPPPEEQAAIVRYLDHVDRRIGRLIRAKQRLIALLEEEKQAIIHRAVTRGLDPNVRLSPSGTELLGDIPEHWEVANLGRCIGRIEQGWSPAAAEGVLEDEQWAVITLSAVRRGQFDSRAIKPISMAAKVPTALELRAGDLLLTRSNTRDRVGDVCLVSASVREKTIFSDLIYRLVCDGARMDRRFLLLVLLSRVGRAQIERDARGSSGTMPKIAHGHIRSWRVGLPPLVEQDAIVRDVEESLSGIDRTIQSSQQLVALLREYRSILIADVVTGKLDVRAAAAELPEEIEEFDDFSELDTTSEDDDVMDEDMDAATEED